MLLFLGIFLFKYLTRVNILQNGIIISSFNEEAENEFLSVSDLEKYDFNKKLLTDYQQFNAGFLQCLPNRNYTMDSCEMYQSKSNMPLYDIVFINEHTDEGYYEYHICHEKDKVRSECIALILEQFNLKNYIKAA